VQTPLPSVTIIIPCYNEAQRLPSALLAAFTMPARRLTFLLVNDGSTDGTIAVLEDLARRAPETIAVLDLVVNKGKAEAVRQGVMHALQSKPDYIGFWDADLATPLDEIAGFCHILDTHPDIEMVLGARVKLMGRAIERKAYRHYFGRVFATAASLVLNLPIYDTQCGAKLFRGTETVYKVFETPFLSRWVFDVEIIARYKAYMGKRGRAMIPAIYEHPLHQWRDVGASKVHAVDAAQAYVDLAKIFLRYRRPS